MKQLVRALGCALGIALFGSAASAGVIEVYPPYSHRVEGTVTTTAFAPGDGFFLQGDDTITFDGALRWSLSFSVDAGVQSMTGDASFAVPAEGMPDGIADASLALYRGTADGVSQGDFGALVHRFAHVVPEGGSWAFAALDAALSPLATGGLYSLVFEGSSVANPYFQARVDFRPLPLEGAQPPPAVPEPPAVLLFMLGAIATGALLRRRLREG